MAWKLWTTQVEEVVLVENGEPGGQRVPLRAVYTGGRILEVRKEFNH